MKNSILAALALSTLPFMGCFTTPPTEERRTMLMEISAFKMPCNTLMAQECLVIREGTDTMPMVVYESIEGFTFEWGYKQTLSVEKQALPEVEDGPSFRYVNRGLVRKVADNAWEYHDYSGGKSFELTGETMRITGYSRAIQIPDAADREKLSAVGEREIFEMYIRPGQDGLLQARSVALVKLD